MPSLSSAMQLRTTATAIDKGTRIGLTRRRVSMMSHEAQGAQLSFRTRGAKSPADFRGLRMPARRWPDERGNRTGH